MEMRSLTDKEKFEKKHYIHLFKKKYDFAFENPSFEQVPHASQVIEDESFSRNLARIEDYLLNSYVIHMNTNKHKEQNQLRDKEFTEDERVWHKNHNKLSKNRWGSSASTIGFINHYLFGKEEFVFDTKVNEVLNDGYIYSEMSYEEKVEFCRELDDTLYQILVQVVKNKKKYNAFMKIPVLEQAKKTPKNQRDIPLDETIILNNSLESSKRINQICEDPKLGAQPIHEEGREELVKKIKAPLRSNCYGTTAYVLGIHNSIKNLWDENLKQRKRKETDNEIVLKPQKRPVYVGEHAMQDFLNNKDQVEEIKQSEKNCITAFYIKNKKDNEKSEFELYHTGVCLGYDKAEPILVHQLQVGDNFSIVTLDECKKELVHEEHQDNVLKVKYFKLK